MIHAAAVVRDADQTLPAGLHLDANRSRASVQRIFQQLFHHGGGPLHHFAGSDLVRYVLRKYPYLRHVFQFALPGPGSLRRHSRFAAHIQTGSATATAARHASTDSTTVSASSAQAQKTSVNPATR